MSTDDGPLFTVTLSMMLMMMAPDKTCMRMHASSTRIPHPTNPGYNHVKHPTLIALYSNYLHASRSGQRRGREGVSPPGGVSCSLRPIRLQFSKEDRLFLPTSKTNCRSSFSHRCKDASSSATPAALGQIPSFQTSIAREMTSRDFPNSAKSNVNLCRSGLDGCD